MNAVFSLASEIKDAIEVEYTTVSVLEEAEAQIALKHLFVEGAEATPERLAGVAADQGIIQLTRQILIGALKERASDIHIEPSEHDVRVRLRIDGVLQERFHLDRRLLAPLASRLKLMAGCDITERRRPQDGRIALPLATRSIDVRLPVCRPSTVRRLRCACSARCAAGPSRYLEELDFSKAPSGHRQTDHWQPEWGILCHRPHGSGKTTTLYAVLKLLNRPER